MSATNEDMVRRTLLDILTARLQTSDAHTFDALRAGLEQIDSTSLLDIILEVEQSCVVVFNPERIDFDLPLTLESLIKSFEPCENVRV